VNVLLPASLSEALNQLASDATAVPMAGGTDLLVHWPVRVEAHERTYVDLSRLDSLKPLRWTEDELILGGLTTYWDVILDARARAELPLLVDAARQVGAIQIQARVTSVNFRLGLILAFCNRCGTSCSMRRSQARFI